MDGIVSCLDSQNDSLVADLWAELERDFGISAVAKRVPIPHFSYHVAERYDQQRVDSVLHQFAAMQKPFKVRTSGFGLFTGAAPVLYLSIVRTGELSQIHKTLWPHLGEGASKVMEYYHPDHWMPHITLAQGDLTPDKLSYIVSRWLDRSFEWEITIDNVSLICDVGKPAMECHIRAEFGA